MGLELELLQVALGTRSSLSRIPTDNEWDAIYEFADKQAILGILFAGVERLPKDQTPYVDLLMEWLGQAEYIKTQNEQANRDCEKITKLFRDAVDSTGSPCSFRTSIMKGQGNCIFYKFKDEREELKDLALLRTSGDIDIWVDGGFGKVNAFVQNVAPTNEINELEIQFHGQCETPVEVHYRPFIMRNPWTNKRLQKFFTEEANSCFSNGIKFQEGSKGFKKDSEGDTYFTTLRFNLIHQLAHIRLHLFTEGIGMKQLIDYYFLLLHTKEDKQEIMQIVDDLGMSNFASAIMWVMKEVFLLPGEKLLCATDEKGGKLLLEDVLKGGNFGHSDDGLKDMKSKNGYSLWALFVRNIRYNRFDRWDWICGPMWRIYHRIWRMIKGYK